MTGKERIITALQRRMPDSALTEHNGVKPENYPAMVDELCS